ncbi:MAG: DUF4153 domain-containing protein [Bacteroidales bacterium]|nr:DUF4153 domain-containing protein [Bacteroidales bacterium]
MMRATDWRSYAASMVSSLTLTMRRNVVESFIVLLTAASCAVLPYFDMKGSLDDFLASVLFFSSIFGPLALLLNALSRSYAWLKVAYWLLIPIYICLVLLGVFAFDVYGIFGAWHPTLALECLVARFLLPMPKNDRALTRRGLECAVVLTTSLCVAVFTTLIILALLATFNYIFDQEVLYYVCYFPPLFLVPMLFMSTFIDDQPDSSGDAESVSIDSEVANGVMNFVVSIAIILYILILYVYGLRIAFALELPRGGVVMRVFWFLLLVIVFGNIYRLMTVRVFEKLYSWLHVLCVPLTALLWVAAYRRVADYGLTDWRVYMLLCCVLVTVWVVVSFFRRGRALLTTILTGMALFAVVGVPGVLSAASLVKIYNDNYSPETVPPVPDPRFYAEARRTNVQIDTRGFEVFTLIDYSYLDRNSHRLHVVDYDHNDALSLDSDSLMHTIALLNGYPSFVALSDSLRLRDDTLPPLRLDLDIPLGDSLVVIITSFTLNQDGLHDVSCRGLLSHPE